MAVENVKSDIYRDPLALGAMPAAMKVHGRIHVVTGTVTHDAAASSGSTYKLGEVPSAAMPHPDTIFEAANWKFTNMRIGTKDDVSALVSALVSAGNQSPKAALDANHGKAWWEVLGLAADPGGMIAIYAHAIDAASAAGSMKFVLASVDN